MNLQKLKFAVEIEKTSSITQAAKNLYLSQPNLSKSIKELESEIGIEIFSRTTKGVEPTPEGKQFLSHAKSILKQIDILEDIYCTPKEDDFQFKISVPRTTYISTGFCDFINSANQKNNTPINVQYRETSNESTISNISSGNCDIGIIRYQKIYEPYFLNLLKEHNLDYEVLWTFKMRLLMSVNHPLAKYEVVPYELLKDYIEIIHGDFQIPTNYTDNDNLQIHKPKNRIYVYDRGSQYDFLKQIEGAYKWASPVPETELERYDLVQKSCNEADINIDMVIYKNKSTLKPYEMNFIKKTKCVIEKELRNFKEK